MSEGYTALLISFGIILLIGFFIPVCLSGFVPDEINENSFISDFTDHAVSGWSFAGITINPFNWFGDNIKEFTIDQLTAFSYIPNTIAIPLLLISLISLIYGAVKLILP